MNFSDILNRILSGETLSEPVAYDVMSAIMQGTLTEAQIAGFLVALRSRGETVDEIVGCARAMRDASVRLSLEDLDLVDTCGTGGTRKGTFNVSTTAALIAAGAGARVAKHGNRAMSGRTGSADVLEALGVKIDAAPAVVERCIREAGIGFMFAPLFHKAMKHAIAPRKQLGVRTVFNVLGPLTNPAGARRQLLGLFSGDIIEIMADAVRRLGARKAWVVHSEDGMDELSIAAPTRVAEVDGDQIRTFRVDPREFGLRRSGLDGVAASSAQESASLLRSVLDGVEGPASDLALFNAAAVLTAAGLTPGLGEGLELARSAVSSGNASRALNNLIQLSNQPL